MKMDNNIKRPEQKIKLIIKLSKNNYLLVAGDASLNNRAYVYFCDNFISLTQ